MKERLEFHSLGAAPTHVAPFSHAVECDGWIQLTGQMPTNPNDDEAPLPDSVADQTHRVMDNLVIVLEGIGLSLDDVLSCRAYFTEFKRDYAAMNQAYQSNFPPELLPARTCIDVADLARDALVEIDSVARRPART